MGIKGLDHFNIICTSDRLQEVISFYTELLDFEEGPRPDFGIEGAWLYREEKPLIHLFVEEEMEDTPAPGVYETITAAVHHIAFDCEGYEAFKSRLERHGIEYYRTIVPGTAVQQLFFHDPVGIRLELNFKNG